ncbi:MAG: helix-turn-helix transcriptional regulator [Lawsonibacter sp.]|nr:helix-turn-helix transcriptional regulator [Lawsonibacter sp.]
MDSFNVMDRVKELCDARAWTFYRLAKEAGIPYSSLSTMLHKSYVPTLPSLMKLCDGFGITLAQFFSPDDEPSKLTQDQLTCLEKWNILDNKSKALALVYMQGLADRQE